MVTILIIYQSRLNVKWVLFSPAVKNRAFSHRPGDWQRQEYNASNQPRHGLQEEVKGCPTRAQGHPMRKAKRPDRFRKTCRVFDALYVCIRAGFVDGPCISADTASFLPYSTVV